MFTGRREINDLAVKCEYCTDKTTYGDVEYHLKKCKYTSVLCPNKCGKKNTKHVKRMDLSHHLKEECHNRSTSASCVGRQEPIYQELGPSHEQNCPKRKVDCPNAGCGKNVEHHLLGLHIAHECDYTKIPCEVCGTQVASKKWNDHRLHDAHHAIHMKTMVVTAAILETVQNASEAAERKSEKTSEAVVQLRRELNFLRLVLIKAGVVCVILLAAVLTLIVVLTLRGSNETEAISDKVSIVAKNVHKLQSLIYDSLRNDTDSVRMAMLAKKAAALIEIMESLEHKTAKLETAGHRATTIKGIVKLAEEESIASLEKVIDQLITVESKVAATEKKAKKVIKPSAIPWWVTPLVMVCCCMCCLGAANEARERERRPRRNS